MRLVTAEQMRAIDRRAIEELGLPGAVLMENAGRATADRIEGRFAPLHPGPVAVLCGRGNNGGDGFVVARHLRNRGWQVQTVVLAPAEAFRGDAALNLALLQRSGAPLAFAPDAAVLASSLAALAGTRLAVDALFGTGLNQPVAGHYAAAIAWLNGCGAPVAAVDIPSGVDADSGRILGVAVRAALTVTFAWTKLGQVLHPGADLVGRLETVDIGIPRDWAAALVGEGLQLLDAADARRLLPARPATGHKGTFGHLLVVAGSQGKLGAAALAAEAGVRSGAGLVTLAAPASLQAALAVKLTEVMTAGLAEANGALARGARDALLQLCAGKAALAVGPGLGLAAGTVEVVRQLLQQTPLPLVLDADALNALAGDPALLAARPGPPPVLTPHPGEMARLCGVTVAEVEADRVGVARAFAARLRVILVLKGARSVVAAPDGRVAVNGSGNPGLASGGMGDVLTGLVGGLLAQGVEAFDAARLGVYLHGLAGDRLAARLGTAGLAAGDLLRELPAARHQLQIGADGAQ